MPAVTVTCETCGKPFEAMSDRARFCGECQRARRIAYLTEYRAGVRKGTTHRLTAAQAAIADRMIRERVLTDAEIADECRRLGVPLTKEGVTSRRRRLGVRSVRAVNGDVEPPLVLVRARNAIEAVSKSSPTQDVDFNPPNEATPTEARPGTRAKVEELAARILAGMPLWHPEDAGMNSART